MENLKIYSTIILDNNILDPSIRNVENKIESLNKNIKRNIKYNLLKYQNLWRFPDLWNKFFKFKIIGNNSYKLK